MLRECGPRVEEVVVGLEVVDAEAIANDDVFGGAGSLGNGMHLSVMACHSSVGEQLFPPVLPLAVVATLVLVVEVVSLVVSAKALATILYRFESSLGCTMLNMVRRFASRSLSPVARKKNSFPMNRDQY